MSDWANDHLEDEGIDARTVEVDDDAGGEAQPTLYYGSVDEFVREYLRHVYRRRTPRVGCPLVGARRSGHPTRSALASMGAPTPRPRHRHERVVARPRRPPHGSPDGT